MSPRMLAAARWLPLSVLVSGTSACVGSVAGQWRLERASPSKEVFALDEVAFAADGTYSATITLEGRTVRETGSFEFTGFELTLRPSAGGRRTYDARLGLGTLELRGGEKRFVILKQVAR